MNNRALEIFSFSLSLRFFYIYIRRSTSREVKPETFCTYDDAVKIPIELLLE